VIRVVPDSPRTGDTARVSWDDLPAGSKVLAGPRESDSLAVRADTSRAGRWVVQPLGLSRFGGDTLVAVTPSGDTVKDVVPPFQARARVQGADSAAASLLPPQRVPVPFPWDVVGWSAFGVALAVLAIWGWKRWKAWKASRVPPPPPPPPRDPAEVCREKLDELERASRAGAPARETAFAAGELLRGLHGTLHGWDGAVESTSLEWKSWSARRPEPERLAVTAFLDEADLLRYADSNAGADMLLARARILLEEIDRRRAESA
jgi:hypothetical protein